MVYPVNYFFATMQQRLEDGRSFGVSMGDGLGSDVPKLSNEDFLTLGGKVHKLDLTVVQEDLTNLMSVKHLKSVSRGLFEAECDLIYTPAHEQHSLIYAVVIAISQKATYGTYTGTCIVAGERIAVESWGFFEHVHFRW